MPINMKHSKDVLPLVSSFEGCKLKAYFDSMGGVWTIAWGHTRNVKEGDTCTLAQAYQYLQADLDEAETYVNKMVDVSLTQSEFDALVDFTFNLGWVRLHNSTLLHKLNAEDFQGAANEFEKWSYSKGTKIAGLLRRRVAEETLFCKDSN